MISHLMHPFKLVGRYQTTQSVDSMVLNFNKILMILHNIIILHAPPLIKRITKCPTLLSVKLSVLKQLQIRNIIKDFVLSMITL